MKHNIAKLCRASLAQARLDGTWPLRLTQEQRPLGQGVSTPKFLEHKGVVRFIRFQPHTA